MNRKSASVATIVLAALMAVSGLGLAAQEFQSSVAPNDLVTYGFYESNNQQVTFCSIGNTANVLDAGAETVGQAINAIIIDPGGDCTFFLSTEQTRGTYHLQARLRAEISPTNPTKTSTIHIRILTNFRTTDSLYYGIVVADNTQVTGISTNAGVNGAEKPYTAVDFSLATLKDVRDWHGSDNMNSQINFKNNGPERIYLDAVYMSTTQ